MHECGRSLECEKGDQGRETGSAKEGRSAKGATAAEPQFLPQR